MSICWPGVTSSIFAPHSFVLLRLNSAPEPAALAPLLAAVAAGPPCDEAVGAPASPVLARLAFSSVFDIHLFLSCATTLIDLARPLSLDMAGVAGRVARTGDGVVAPALLLPLGLPGLARSAGTDPMSIGLSRSCSGKNSSRFS